MALPPENIIIKRSKVISSTSDSNVEDNDVQDIKQKTSHKKTKIKEDILPQLSNRQIQIIGVFLALFSLLILIALLSYTSKDEANADIHLQDIFSIIKGDQDIQAKADTTYNLLGLFGAVLADMLFNKSFGFISIVFPFIGFIWSKELLFNDKISLKSIRSTSYILLFSLIISAFFGTLSLSFPQIRIEWYGTIGLFQANIYSSLIGKFGSLLLCIVAGFITVTLGLNITLHTAISTLSHYISSLFSWLRTFFEKTHLQSSSGKDIKNKTISFNDTYHQQDIGTNEEPVKIVKRMSTITQHSDDMQRHMPVIIRGNEFNDSDDPGIILAERPKKNTSNLTFEEALAERSVFKPPVEQTEEKKAADSIQLDFTKEAAQPSLVLNVQEVVLQSYDLPPKDLHHYRMMIQDEKIKYSPPILELLQKQNEHVIKVDDAELKENARLLQEKLLTFKITIQDLTVTPGPVVTQYEFVPAAGIKISQIENLSDDIALALKARGIRIIAPVPGRGTVAIEIPNHKPSLVLFSSIIKSSKFHDSEHRLSLALGKTISGEVYCADLSRMPHLLIAGSTGAGKSVGINTVICSLLYKMHPKDLKFVIIDPKKVEMTYYGLLKNHFLALSPDTDEHIITTPQNAVAVLKSLCVEMMNRYEILAKVGQRNIVDYNQKVKEGKYKDSGTEHSPMPYIVCVIDELADLMLTAGREVEEPIIRLAQLARAVGIHMIVATQRPSVDVITGLIKANFPARISYQVASKIDSRTIIDGGGADQLLGNGDMLFLPGGSPKPIRIQNSFLSTDEVENICMHIGNQQGYSKPYMLPTSIEKTNGGSSLIDDSRDELFEEAAKTLIRHQQGSVSLLQRRLKVGYARAARIMDELEAAGIVGSFDGSKGREVLLNNETDLEALL